MKPTIKYPDTMFKSCVCEERDDSTICTAVIHEPRCILCPHDEMCHIPDSERPDTLESLDD